MVVPTFSTDVCQGRTCGSSTPQHTWGDPPPILSCLRLSSLRTVSFTSAIAAPGTQPCLRSVCKGEKKGREWGTKAQSTPERKTMKDISVSARCLSYQVSRRLLRGFEKACFLSEKKGICSPPGLAMKIKETTVSPGHFMTVIWLAPGELPWGKH